MATYDAVDRIGTGAAVAVRGTLVESQGAGQKFEVKVHGAPPARPAPRRTAPRAEWRRAARQASAIEVVGDCADPKYPLQKKRHSLEFLRSIAHLRPRTNTIASVARVRSALAQATHNFFQQEGFFYLQSPLITASDCEGAGEMFRVTTLPSQARAPPRPRADPSRARTAAVPLRAGLPLARGARLARPGRRGQLSLPRASRGGLICCGAGR